MGALANILGRRASRYPGGTPPFLPEDEAHDASIYAASESSSASPTSASPAPSYPPSASDKYTSDIAAAQTDPTTRYKPPSGLRRIMGAVTEGTAGFYEGTPNQWDPRDVARTRDRYFYGDLPERQAQQERDLKLSGEAAAMEQRTRKNDIDLFEAQQRGDYYQGMNDTRATRDKWAHEDRVEERKRREEADRQSAIDKITGRGGRPAPREQVIPGIGATPAMRAATSTTWRPMPADSTLRRVGEEEFEIPSPSALAEEKRMAGMLSYDPATRKVYREHLGIELPEMGTQREVDTASAMARAYITDDRARDLGERNASIAEIRANRSLTNNLDARDELKQEAEKRKAQEAALRTKNADVQKAQIRYNLAIKALDKELDTRRAQAVNKEERTQIYNEIQARKDEAARMLTQEKQTAEDIFGQETTRLGGSYTPGVYDEKGKFVRGGQVAPSSTSQVAPSSTSTDQLPPEAIAALKVGVRTTFANGQTWLKNPDGSVIKVN